jgi:hypothetical protein
MHIRHVEEEHTTYWRLAVVSYQRPACHDAVGVGLEIRLMGGAPYVTQGWSVWLVKAVEHGLDMARVAWAIPPGVGHSRQPAVDIPALLHAANDIGLLSHMTIGYGTIGKVD